VLDMMMPCIRGRLFFQYLFRRPGAADRRHTGAIARHERLP
jgi:hypothetical protein